MLKISIVAALMFLASTPTFASGVWDCTFTAFDGPPGIASHVTIRIVGNRLDWIIAPFDIPIPKTHIAPRALRYRILENNNVGLVAVTSQARTDRDVGSVINSETVAIDKVTGALHAGVVGTKGLHDNLSGTCRPK